MPTTLTATVKDSGGNLIPGASVYWTIDDPTICTVDPRTGVLTPVAEGTTTVRAKSGAVEATATVVVTSSNVPPNPTLGAISPTSAAQGATALSVTVDGFDMPSDTTLVFSNAGIHVDDVTPAQDGESLTGHIHVDANASLGAGTVKLHSDTAGDSGTLPFTVTAPVTETLVLTSGGVPVDHIAGTAGVDYVIDGAYLSTDPETDVLAGVTFATSDKTIVAIDPPTITSVDVTSIAQGESKLVTITGTRARAGQSLGGVTSSGLSQSGFAVISPTEWQVTLTATSGAAVATDGLYIIDSNGDSNTVAESVTASGPPNLLTDPNDLTTAAWTVSGGTPTRTVVSGVVLPDGSTGSVTELALEANNVDGVEQGQAVSGGTASKSFTVSAWVRAVSGTGEFRLKNSQEGGPDSYKTCTATTAWQQFQLQVTNGAGAGDGVQIAGIRASGNTLAADLYVYDVSLTTP